MKKIKVCLAFLLAIMLVLSSTTVSYAYLPPDDPDGPPTVEDLVIRRFHVYCQQETGDLIVKTAIFDLFKDCPGTEPNSTKIYYLINFRSYEGSLSIFGEPIPYYNRFGDNNEYYEYCDMTNHPYGSGYAVYYGDPVDGDPADDEFMSLSELYERNPEAVEYILKNDKSVRVYSVVKQHSWGKVGDADGNYEISIADATEIQKHLADLTTLEGVNLRAADIGNKGAPSISDATNIQFYLASFVDKL